MNLAHFWDKVEPMYNQPDACLKWQGATNSDGYGNVVVNGKTEKAHRVAYALTKGEIPKGFEICHSCDTPSCCNPNHLWLGTHRQNTDDMTKKRRFAKKVSEVQVDEIRTLRANGLTLTVIASRYGISFQQVHRIVTLECWKNTGG